MTKSREKVGQKSSFCEVSVQSSGHGYSVIIFVFEVLGDLRSVRLLFNFKTVPRRDERRQNLRSENRF